MQDCIVERLKNIIITLLSAEVVGDSLTINDLAERFKLSLPCVRNDIAELMNVSNKVECGFGIVFEDESLDDEYINLKKNIKNGKLDDKELSITFSSTNGVAYISLDYSEYDAILKIVDNINGRFLSNKYSGEEIYKLCQDYNTYTNTNRVVHAKIVKAIEDGEGIQFLYKRAGKIENIKIKPIRVVEYESFGKSYVVSQENGSIVAYRLDRIKNVETVKIKSEPIDSALFEKLDYVWDMDFKGEFDVRFKVFNDNAGRVIEKVKRDLKQYVDRAGYRITEQESGNIMVEGHVVGKGAFERYIRSYGASIVVFEPAEVVDDIIKSNKYKKEIYEA